MGPEYELAETTYSFCRMFGGKAGNDVGLGNACRALCARLCNSAAYEYTFSY
jgi:hypothetical protein